MPSTPNVWKAPSDFRKSVAASSSLSASPPKRSGIELATRPRSQVCAQGGWEVGMTRCLNLHLHDFGEHLLASQTDFNQKSKLAKGASRLNLLYACSCFVQFAAAFVEGSQGGAHQASLQNRLCAGPRLFGQRPPQSIRSHRSCPTSPDAAYLSQL